MSYSRDAKEEHLILNDSLDQLVGNRDNVLNAMRKEITKKKYIRK